MKMKKLVIALAMLASASLSYAVPNAPLTTEQQTIVNQALSLPVPEVVTLAQQYPDLAFAIYEALANANPQSAAALASQLTIAAPDQAATIASAMVSGVNGDIDLTLAIIDAVKTAAPSQAEQVNNQVSDVVLNIFTASVAHVDHANDTPATVNSQQQLVNNIQLAANQGILGQNGQNRANALIAGVVDAKATADIQSQLEKGTITQSQANAQFASVAEKGGNGITRPSTAVSPS